MVSPPSRANVPTQMLQDLDQKRGIDVVITTHNPAMIDALGGQMIPVVTVAHRDVKTGAN